MKIKAIVSRLLFVIAFAICSTSTSAEPFIVLKFSSDYSVSDGDGINSFSLDPEHSESYKVKSGDSLNSIIDKFYLGSGLDRRFVQLAILIVNPKAFANKNPNFLFSDKSLYLPGKNDIQKLLSGKKVKPAEDKDPSDFRTRSIYFFGG
ncbi:MAG: hypothetical protein VYE27_04005 [Pseudomonadota bacterium]|nr:hypothetical protein [Pseudomonadota bacterium]